MYKNIKEFVLSLLMYLCSFFVKRKKNWYAFGSWKGELYIDNSRYLYEYIRKKDPECVCIWIGVERIKKEILQHPNTRVYSKNSLRSMVALLKCKYMFCSQMHSDDLCNYNVYRNAVITYLHHGMPVKKWGADSAGGHHNFNAAKGLKKLIRVLVAKEIRYDYFATSSELHEKTNLSSLDYRGCVAKKNLKSGTPRNDMLVNADKAFMQALREKYAKQLDFAPSKKMIMYLPTFRRKGTPTRSFVNGIGEDEYEMIHQVLEQHNAILIEKNHFAEDARGGNSSMVKRDGIIHVDQNVNVQEMLMICDVLISDYSGAFLDFVLLDRPIIHYAYDYEDYKNNDSGLYYEIEDFAAGEVAYDLSALCTCLEKGLLDPAFGRERRRYIRNKYMTYEKGVASQRIYDWVCVK